MEKIGDNKSKRENFIPLKKGRGKISVRRKEYE